MQSGVLVMRALQMGEGKWQRGARAAACRVSMQSVNLWVLPGLMVDMQQLQCGAGGALGANEIACKIPL